MSNKKPMRKGPEFMRLGNIVAKNIKVRSKFVYENPVECVQETR